MSGSEPQGIVVIGAGFGRTGTLSTREALRVLGVGPCYHMVEILSGNFSHAYPFLAAAEGRPVDWKRLFKNYHSTIDWPACAFYKELMLEYPDAKVLLNVRDPEKWYKSAQNTIYAAASETEDLLITRLLTACFDTARVVSSMIKAVIWEGTFDGRFEDKEFAIGVFNQHIADVKAHVPADRLLEFRVTDGWEPLCNFLDLPVPDQPFPHLNDTAHFRSKIDKQKRANAVLKTVLFLSPVLAAIAVSRFCCK